MRSYLTLPSLESRIQVAKGLSDWLGRAKIGLTSLRLTKREALYHLAFFIVYAGAVEGCQHLVFQPLKISFFWAPTGIALSGLILLGRRAVVSIALGVFLVNLHVNRHPPVAFSMAIGNSLEALTGASLILWLLGDRPFGRNAKSVGLFLLAATSGPAISATFGTGSQYLTHRLTLGDAFIRWMTWWVENYLGILAITPLVLAWVQGEAAKDLRGRYGEAAVAFLFLVVVGAFIFGVGVPQLPISYSVGYLLLFPLFWAGFRFGIGGVSAAVLTLALLSTYGTGRGFGPFYNPNPWNTLLFLQLFLVSSSVMAFFVAGIISDREDITRELSGSNRELERFASVASHDLREPLRGIHSFSNLLSRRTRQKLDNEEREYLDFIIASSKRLYVLTEALLDYSRINKTIERRPVAANAVVNEALANLRESILAAEATVDCGQLPELQCDPKLLTLVFQNLVANGLKYHRAGVSPRIAITYERRGKAFVFSVCDNGTGIPKVAEKRIFEAFQRGVSDQSDIPGVGLGLAITKRIVESHGGRIWLHATSAGGTTICFTLPADH